MRSGVLCTLVKSGSKPSVARSPKTNAPPGIQTCSTADGPAVRPDTVQGASCAALHAPTSDELRIDSDDGNAGSSARSSSRPDATQDRPPTTSDGTPKQSPRNARRTSTGPSPGLTAIRAIRSIVV